MTQYVFGIGTGRCGTASLARLLDVQENSCFGHENMPLHWWNIMADYEAAKRKVIKMGDGKDIAGSIAYYWLPYMHKLVEDFPNVKFIYLWRDKEEVVESFWERNQNRINDKTYPEKAWLSSYPFLRYPPTKEAIADTVATYENMIEQMMFYYAHRIFVTNMENLNNMDKMSKLLEFVGIPKDKQVLQECRENVGGQVKLGSFHTVYPKASTTDVLNSERLKEIIQ